MTAKGRNLLVASVLAYLAGSWLGFVELNVLGASGLLLTALALATVMRPATLEAERRLAPERVTAGEPAEGLLTVTNPGPRRSRATLGWEAIYKVHPDDGRLAADPAAGTELPGPGPGSASAALPGVALAVSKLAPRRAQTLAYPVPTDRRAVLRVGPFVLTRSDPFGLVERRSRLGAPAQLRVHPRVHPLGPLPVGRQRDLEGPTAETARGDAVFHALREYVVGDDLRRVHWKATAHRGSLMVREHADPTRPDATVVLDDRLAVGLDDDGFDLVVEAVASVAVTANRAGFPVRVLSASGRFRTPTLVDDGSLLDLLAGVGQHDQDEVAGLASGLVAGPGGHALVVVTGRPDPTDLPYWASASRRYTTAVLVAVLGAADGPVGADEVLPPAPPGMTVLAVRSGDDLVAQWGSLR